MPPVLQRIFVGVGGHYLGRPKDEIDPAVISGSAKYRDPDGPEVPEYSRCTGGHFSKNEAKECFAASSLNNQSTL